MVAQSQKVRCSRSLGRLSGAFHIQKGPERKSVSTVYFGKLTYAHPQDRRLFVAEYHINKRNKSARPRRHTFFVHSDCPHSGDAHGGADVTDLYGFGAEARMCAHQHFRFE